MHAINNDGESVNERTLIADWRRFTLRYHLLGIIVIQQHGHGACQHVPCFNHQLHGAGIGDKQSKGRGAGVHDLHLRLSC